jgi:hypothetical protein
VRHCERVRGSREPFVGLSHDAGRGKCHDSELRPSASARVGAAASGSADARANSPSKSKLDLASLKEGKCAACGARVNAAAESALRADKSREDCGCATGAAESFSSRHGSLIKGSREKLRNFKSDSTKAIRASR